MTTANSRCVVKGTHLQQNVGRTRQSSASSVCPSCQTQRLFTQEKKMKVSAEDGEVRRIRSFGKPLQTEDRRQNSPMQSRNFRH